jgi:4'-phosphopantetheinyl transferase
VFPKLATLQNGACQLWYWQLEALPPALLERAIPFLSDGELARYHRYRVNEPARTFLAARFLLRSLLSAYGALDPREWRFAANPWGRPYILNPDPACHELVFNLSHKPGMVTCLAGWDRRLGVDVEDTSASRTYWLQVADRFFSPSEVAKLHQLPPDRQPNRFFELWTLKEAYIKARGRGLSLGLSAFSFSPEHYRATVQFDAGFDDDPARWDFRFFRPDAKHLIATAVSRTPSGEAPIAMADAAPFVTPRLHSTGLI